MILNRAQIKDLRTVAPMKNKIGSINTVLKKIKIVPNQSCGTFQVGEYTYNFSAPNVLQSTEYDHAEETIYTGVIQTTRREIKYVEICIPCEFTNPSLVSSLRLIPNSTYFHEAITGSAYGLSLVYDTNVNVITTNYSELYFPAHGQASSDMPNTDAGWLHPVALVDPYFERLSAFHGNIRGVIPLYSSLTIQQQDFNNYGRYTYVCDYYLLNNLSIEVIGSTAQSTDKAYKSIGGKPELELVTNELMQEGALHGATILPAYLADYIKGHNEKGRLIIGFDLLDDKASIHNGDAIQVQEISGELFYGAKEFKLYSIISKIANDKLVRSCLAAEVV